MKRKKKKKNNVRRITIKLALCLVYMMVITILLACGYRIFENEKKITPWSLVESVNDYTYIDISKMSEKFAYYEGENIGLHFVIEEEDTGLWHTYVVAIDEDNYNLYKGIIDYTYERTEEKPESIKAYGYPSIMSAELKKMILNNIKNFLPADNENEITEANLEQYLTNSYLDTTKVKQDEFNGMLFLTMLLFFVMIGLVIFTIFDKDKIVDNIEDKVDELEVKTKKVIRFKPLKNMRKKKGR